MTTTLPSTADIDYIIGANAHEESRLAELVADVTQTYPALSGPAARALLREGLTRLMSAGRVGMYECTLPGPEGAAGEMVDLPMTKALDIVASDQHWDWEPVPNQPLMFLFAIDMDLETLATASLESGAHGS